MRHRLSYLSYNLNMFIRKTFKSGKPKPRSGAGARSGSGVSGGGSKKRGRGAEISRRYSRGGVGRFIKDNAMIIWAAVIIVLLIMILASFVSSSADTDKDTNPTEVTAAIRIERVENSTHSLSIL